MALIKTRRPLIRHLRGLFVGHQGLAIFLMLAVGMALLVLIAVQGVPLEPSQRIWLVAFTVMLAGLSAWFIAAT